jgi:hypothetical protein
MKLKHSVATMILAVGLMTGAAHAKPIPDGGVTVTDIADVMKAKGYKAEVTTDNSGDPMIKSAGSGVKFEVYFYGCNSSKRCTSIQFSAGFDLDKGLALSKINEWNYTKRFGRGALDDEMDPYIRYDLDVEKGFTTEAVANNLDTWDSILSSFKTFINY